ncbi:hypothetical protein C7M84_020889 [Penaeus vannamei]|uniref:Uncharacterized protein n=1 Tax=Penaeus vannamei TaxID=6689 RepID=A0A3R7PW54_PENVA|nr:hypothetical protein C7M84_020889 [Penaeus vannamei]
MSDRCPMSDSYSPRFFFFIPHFSIIFLSTNTLFLFTPPPLLTSILLLLILLFLLTLLSVPSSPSLSSFLLLSSANRFTSPSILYFTTSCTNPSYLICQVSLFPPLLLLLLLSPYSLSFVPLPILSSTTFLRLLFIATPISLILPITPTLPCLCEGLGTQSTSSTPLFLPIFNPISPILYSCLVISQPSYFYFPPISLSSLLFRASPLTPLLHLTLLTHPIRFLLLSLFLLLILIRFSLLLFIQHPLSPYLSTISILLPSSPPFSLFSSVSLSLPILSSLFPLFLLLSHPPPSLSWSILPILPQSPLPPPSLLPISPSSSLTLFPLLLSSFLPSFLSSYLPSLPSSSLLSSPLPPSLSSSSSSPLSSPLFLSSAPSLPSLSPPLSPSHPPFPPPLLSPFISPPSSYPPLLPSLSSPLPSPPFSFPSLSLFGRRFQLSESVCCSCMSGGRLAQSAS